MMKRMMSGLVPTTIMAVALSACGGGPDVDQVKADFENPSGSTKDKNGVIAASGKQSAAGNNSALSLAGGGVPGFGLTATGRGSGFAKIAPRTVFGPKLTNLAAVATKRSDLRVAQAEVSCFDGEDFAAAEAELQQAIANGDESVSVSVSTSVDLGDCNAGMTGTMDLSMDMKIEAGLIAYDVEYTMSNVCETASGDCLDGAMAQQASINLAEGGFGSIKAVSAWDLTADYTDEAGAKQSIKTKGGLRIGFSSTAMGESAKVEYLNYVVDSSGNEVSYVLTIEATSEGMLTLAIRGADGEMTCSFSEVSGTGMCSGTDSSGAAFEVSWTEGEYTDVTGSEDFKG